MIDTITIPAWHDDAACAFTPDRNLFFTEGGGRPARRKVDAAKAICARCPVIAACLTDAVATDARGVWGGTTFAERYAMRPENALVPAGPYRDRMRALIESGLDSVDVATRAGATAPRRLADTIRRVAEGVGPTIRQKTADALAPVMALGFMAGRSADGEPADLEVAS